MWDLIVSVPDHCLSFYFTYFLVVIYYVFDAKIQNFWLMVAVTSKQF